MIKKAGRNKDQIFNKSHVHDQPNNLPEKLYLTFIRKEAEEAETPVWDWERDCSFSGCWAWGEGALKSGGIECASDSRPNPEERRHGPTPAAPMAPKSPSMVTADGTYGGSVKSYWVPLRVMLQQQGPHGPQGEHGRSKERRWNWRALSDGNVLVLDQH